MYFFNMSELQVSRSFGFGELFWEFIFSISNYFNLEQEFKTFVKKSKCRISEFHYFPIKKNRFSSYS